MDPVEPVGWPRSRWELSAAESYMLLYGLRTSKPSQPFKLAVLELVARRVLELVEIRHSGVFRRRKVPVLTRGEGATGNRVLLAVRDLYVSCGKTAFPNGVIGVEVKTLAEQAGKRYGQEKGFAQALVMKVLSEQGYYEREQRSFLGIIPYHRWTLTRTGEAAKAQLTLTMRLGESQFNRWVDREPNRALAYIGLVGPAILLMEPLHSELKRLHEVQQRPSDSGDNTGSSIPDDDTTSGEDTQDFDLGDLDLGGFDFDLNVLDFDFDVLDIIDDVFDSIDSGVDAGGGDGGDGGGDGGNGGD